jgi:CheY-like chemotaxis protein
MSLRCLIVDDNAGFLRSARGLLESEGVTVAVASNGDDAVRQAKALNHDVALVDIDLGAEDGFDVAGRLRGPAGTPLDVILISTYGEDDFADLITAHPALGFISKCHLTAHAIDRLLRRP